MVICPSCGEQNFLSGETCWACGKALQAPEAAAETGGEAAVSGAVPTPTLEAGPEPAPAAEAVPPSAPASPPEAPVPLAVLEARRRQAELDAMMQPRSAPPPPDEPRPAPFAWTTRRSPPNQFGDVPRFLGNAYEQEVLIRTWLRKKALWVVLAVIFGANLLERQPGLQFPFWLLIVILGVAYARSRRRPR